MLSLIIWFCTLPLQVRYAAKWPQRHLLCSLHSVLHFLRRDIFFLLCTSLFGEQFNLPSESEPHSPKVWTSSVADLTVETHLKNTPKHIRRVRVKKVKGVISALHSPVCHTHFSVFNLFRFPKDEITNK
jgi:hypothetical protein